jgi:hypothetical protein
MDGAPPGRPWLLIAAALVLAALLTYVVLGAYLPSRQRMARLEAEIRDAYQKEAQAQTDLAQALQREATLQQQINALTAERDALLKRARDLEPPPARRPRP